MSSCGCAAGTVASVPATMFEFAPLTTLVVGLPILLLLLLLYPLLVLLTPTRRAPLPSELQYLTAAPGEGKRSEKARPLPTLQDPASIQLSVVIPAYNERARLGIMLDEAIDYLETLLKEKRALAQGLPGSKKEVQSNGTSRSPSKVRGEKELEDVRAPLRSYEILIVDDGSTDGTAEVALDYARAKKLGNGAEIRVVRLEKNRGKGGAVRHGILHARGALLLFADADGATRFADLSLLCAEVARIQTPAGHAVVVGSRAHLVGSEAVVKRSFIRNLLMHGFHLFLSLLLRPPSLPSLSWLPFLSPTLPAGMRQKLPSQPEIRDTQCGFKLFTRASARAIFPLAHIERWIFDVELLLLAEMASKASRGSVLDARRRADKKSNGDLEEDPKAPATLAEDKAAPAATADPLLDLPLPIAEIPVQWAEVGGSKIDLLKDSIRMALDLCVIRANYALGRWKSPKPVSIDARA